jgi:hypothetical protein
MKTGARYIFICFLTMTLSGCLNNYNTLPVCRVENDQMIFKLSKRLNKEQMKEIAARYEIDSNLIFMAYSGSGAITKDSITWKYKNVNKYFVELSRRLDSRSGDLLKKNEVFIMEDSWVKRPVYVETRQVKYGLNNFSRRNVFRYKTDTAQFILPNNKSAKTVYLSGTFNDWSTMQNPMTLTDSGWLVKVKLKPGKYSYKYIIDGKWAIDPNNKLDEKDNERKTNSVVFCPNHRFELRERSEARRVVLTGNFINWNREGLLMEKSGSGWALDVFLNDGTYAYKFIAEIGRAHV